MRKIMLIVVIFASMMLSGCSLLGEVNNSLEYVNAAKEHIGTLSQFAEVAPQLVKDAASNPEVKQELENQLVALKDEIQQFNQINVPTIAKDIHQQLVNKNDLLLGEINNVVENGHLMIDKLYDSQIFNTIQDITSLLNRIEQLGL